MINFFCPCSGLQMTDDAELLKSSASLVVWLLANRDVLDGGLGGAGRKFSAGTFGPSIEYTGGHFDASFAFAFFNMLSLGLLSLGGGRRFFASIEDVKTVL